MKPHQCGDRPNCGRVFYAYSDQYGSAQYCPYCAEIAEVLE